MDEGAWGASARGENDNAGSPKGDYRRLGSGCRDPTRLGAPGRQHGGNGEIRMRRKRRYGQEAD